ncbi:MAG: hypothetical protein ACLUN0_02775 [Roseburia sp.]
MIFLAVYHRKRRKTSRGEVERRALICYTKADESEAIMKKIKYMAVVLATGLLMVPAVRRMRHRIIKMHIGR